MRFSSLLTLCLRNKFLAGNADCSHKLILLLLFHWLTAEVPRRERSDAVSAGVVPADPCSPQHDWIFLSLTQGRRAVSFPACSMVDVGITCQGEEGASLERDASSARQSNSPPSLVSLN